METITFMIRIRVGASCDKDSGNYDRYNQDYAVIKSELRKFLENLRGTTGLRFRLPSIKEWEFAARGGNMSMNYKYSGSNNIEEVAWYNGNSQTGPHDCAELAPNELGLYDMSGNYAEVCDDVERDIALDGNLQFNIDEPLYGGSWKELSSNCLVSSWKAGDTSAKKIPGTNKKELNAFDARYIAVRLVYSRDEK